MSLGFFHRLRAGHRDAEIHVIVKEGLAQLAALFPGVDCVHPLPQSACLPQVGRQLARSGPFAIFYCLPDSFSSALMGCFTGSKERVGYRGQWRSLLLTRALVRPAPLHRAEAYALLLAGDLPQQMGPLDVSLDLPVTGQDHQATPPFDSPSIVINPNSAAPSRRMSLAKWAALAQALLARTKSPIQLIGSESERACVEGLAGLIGRPERVENLAGRTSLPALAGLLRAACVVVSSDSGPAHLANSLGTPTIVLFGAGDDRVTAPYRRENLRVIRAPAVTCAPCVSNTCRYGHLRCLEEIDVTRVAEVAAEIASRGCVS